jgi:hypothetical protein
VFRRKGPAGSERGAFRRFAERLGLSAAHAMRLVHLGMGMEEYATLGERVRDGFIPVESGATLGEVVSEKGVVRPGDQWLEWAETLSTYALRQLFYERRDEARTGQSVYSVTAYLTPDGMADLRRCRALVSRRAHELATMGQTVAVIAHDWRQEHDPLLQTPGKRRLPPTDTIPDSRYVPAEVDREVRARSDDGCRGPFCDNDVWVQRSHRKAHAKGGNREASNLDLLCDACHKQYEAGLFRIDGPPGAPIFTTPDGKPLERRVGYRSGDDPAAAARYREALANYREAPSSRLSRDSGRGRGAPPDRDHGPPPPAAGPPGEIEPG